MLNAKHPRIIPLLCFVLLLLGCSQDDGRIPVAKTTGKLVWPGNSTMGLMVVLHPVDTAAPKLPVQPTGVIQSDGTFAITCYNTSDGAPAGEYVVTVRGAPRAEDAAKPKLPPSKYLKPTTSPLKVTIEKDGRNELQDLIIES